MWYSWFGCIHLYFAKQYGLRWLPWWLLWYDKAINGKPSCGVMVEQQALFKVRECWSSLHWNIMIRHGGKPVPCWERILVDRAMMTITYQHGSVFLFLKALLVCSAGYDIGGNWDGYKCWISFIVRTAPPYLHFLVRRQIYKCKSFSAVNAI